MMRILASVIAVWLFIGLSMPAAKSDMALPDIEKRLFKSDMLRADFRQEKNLRALSRPLVSHGKLLFVAGEGVLWQVTEPYVMSVLMKPEEIVEWNGEGEVRRVDTAANPVLSALTEIFLAILSGDTQFLEQHFELSPTASDSGWQLDLRPKSKALNAIVSNIRLFGDRFVEEVQVNEAKGDTTSLQFSEFNVEPFELNEIENIPFAQ